AVLASLCGRPTDVVVNGVDCRHYAEVQADAQAQRLLFVGNFEYAPNVDAVSWALNELLPELWRHRPQLRFAICGHAVPPNWPQLWADPRIEWHGFVADLREQQRRASLFVAPLR